MIERWTWVNRSNTRIHLWWRVWRWRRWVTRSSFIDTIEWGEWELWEHWDLHLHKHSSVEQEEYFLYDDSVWFDEASECGEWEWRGSVRNRCERNSGLSQIAKEASAWKEQEAFLECWFDENKEGRRWSGWESPRGPTPSDIVSGRLPSSPLRFDLLWWWWWSLGEWTVWSGTKRGKGMKQRLQCYKQTVKPKRGSLDVTNAEEPYFGLSIAEWKRLVVFGVFWLILLPRRRSRIVTVSLLNSRLCPSNFWIACSAFALLLYMTMAVPWNDFTPQEIPWNCLHYRNPSRSTGNHPLNWRVFPVFPCP